MRSAEADSMNGAVQKIERIKSVFLDTQLFYAKHTESAALTSYLENAEAEFRSIAYESVSVAIALDELEKKQRLDTWLLYAKGPALAHQAQVYVGLGWAIAKLNLPFLPVVEKIDSRLHHRVADGCGYYDGGFRQRQAVMGLQLPAYLPEALLQAYDQGIGRSLWYTSNADSSRVRSRIAGFPAHRQADLWRGVGIAVTYAGGCDDELLKTVLQYAGAHRLQLAGGAALAAQSRINAKTITADTERCARLWFELTADESGLTYTEWVNQADQWLAGIFEKNQ